MGKLFWCHNFRMNLQIQPMLALGETTIFPGLLLLLVLYPMSIWTLVVSWRGQSGRVAQLFAITVIIFGALALAGVLKDFEWPLDESFAFTILFWAFPVACG